MPIPVSIAYEYMDRKEELYKNILMNYTDIKQISGDNDLEMSKIEFYNNNRLILSGNSSIIAVYDTNLSLWQWGWNLPFYTKAENYISRKLLHYAFDIDVANEPDSLSAAIFKSELLNSKIHLQWPDIEIEKLLAISMYLTKSDYYFDYPVKKTEINTNDNSPIARVFYLIKDIKLH
jgi:hypothetical protein